MRAARILRDELGSGLDFLHAKSAAALWRAVSGLMSGGQLWLTALGRSLPGDCSDKHRIKAIDRLLGNKGLHSARLGISATLARWVLRGIPRPTIAVDWTHVSAGFYALSAAVCFSGRALPLLTCVYPEKLKCSPRAERDFLKKLQQVVPSQSNPVLLTDAGFYTDWFERVRKLGWDFIGRIRHRYGVIEDGRWIPLLSFLARAGRKPRCFGQLTICKKSPYELRIVLSAKRKTKGRKRHTRNGTVGRCTADRQRTDQARDPWLLATSLGDHARVVVDLYAKRMQIEERFRDLKSHRHGWSLEDVRCKSTARIEMLFLIAALASIATHVIGFAAEKRDMHRGLQANTSKRRVFSTFFLGRLILRHRRCDELTAADIHFGFDQLALLVHAAAAP